MVVSKFVLTSFCIGLLALFAYSNEEWKKETVDVWVDLTVRVETTFIDADSPQGYPWSKDEVVVGCGWAKITYLGHEITNRNEQIPIIVNIPIGQSCDFSEYIATPINPKKFSLIKWQDQYFYGLDP